MAKGIISKVKKDNLRKYLQFVLQKKNYSFIEIKKKKTENPIKKLAYDMNRHFKKCKDPL